MVNFDGHVLLINVNGLKKINRGIKNKKINRFNNNNNYM